MAITVQDKFTLNELQAPFPPEQVKQREGPKKGGVASYFKYVPSNFLQARLDAVLGLGWNWEIISSHTQSITKTKAIWENRQKVGEEVVQVEQVIVHGRLSFELEGGNKIIRDAFGGCDTNYGTSAGDPHKIADSNAFRKACDKLGLAQEVGGEEYAAKSTGGQQGFGGFKTQAVIPNNGSSSAPVTRTSNPFTKS